MWKLKFRWVLPSAFLCLSAGELIFSARLDALLLPLRAYIGRAGDLWHAVNAPALFFLAIAIHYAPIRLPHNFPHIWVDIVLFLSGGVVLWFVIGNMLDRRQPSTLMKVPRNMARAAQAFILVWGIYLCWQGVHMVSATDYLARHLPGAVLDGTLVLLWSAILIILPVRSFLHAVRSAGMPSGA